MGWTCQHDHNGYCKLIQKSCVPGMNGCILKKNKYTFSTGNFEEDKKTADKKKDELNSKEKDNSAGNEVDFAALARSN